MLQKHNKTQYRLTTDALRYTWKLYLWFYFVIVNMIKNHKDQLILCEDLLYDFHQNANSIFDTNKDITFMALCVFVDYFTTLFVAGLYNLGW
jgi:hypothetical protein